MFNTDKKAIFVVISLFKYAQCMGILLAKAIAKDQVYTAVILLSFSM